MITTYIESNTNTSRTKADVSTTMLQSSIFFVQCSAEDCSMAVKTTIFVLEVFVYKLLSANLDFLFVSIHKGGDMHFIELFFF